MNNNCWNAIIVLLGLSLSTITHATELSGEDYGLYPGDFNGDGKTDLLYVAKDPAKLSGIAVSDGNGPNIVWQTWVSNYLNIDWSRNQYVPLVADFNGDSKADIFLQSATGGDSYLLLSDSRGYVVGINQTLSNAIFGSALALSADQHKLVAGNFAGGPRAALFLQATTASGTHGIAYPDGNGQFTQGVAQSWTNTIASPGGFKWSTQDANVFAADFNGDGMADLLLQAKPRWVMIDYDVTFPVPTYPNGMNGIAYGNASTISFGASFKLWNRNDYGIDWSPLTHNLVVGNFNGDNFADVLFQPKNSTDTAYLLLRNGSNPAEFLSTPSTLTSSGIGGASSRLIAGKFTSSGSTGLYYQALTAGGTNYVSGAAGSTATTHAYSSIATNFLVPALPPGQTTVAGRTKGAFSVERSGTAQYKLPIWVPPGVRGVQPNLQFGYSGTTSIGTMGSGWSVSGLPSIYPCVKQLPPTELCLNGRRLHLKPPYDVPPYDEPPRLDVYKNGKLYSDGSDFPLVIAHSNDANLTNLGTPTGNIGDIYFTAFGKDGLIYEFGNTSDSKSTIYHFMVNKVSDRNGNSYTVTYDPTSPNAPIPLSIAYTATYAGSATFKYFVDFNYVDAGYSTTTWYPLSQGNQITGLSWAKDGYRLTGTKLLTNVTVRSGNTTVRKYSLTYETSPVVHRSEQYAFDRYYSTYYNALRLTHIQECADSLGALCLAPTDMTYNNTADSPPGVNVYQAGDLLQSITDGYGVAFNVGYDTVPVTYPQPTPATTYKKMVSQVTASDGLNGTYTQQYSYVNVANESPSDSVGGWELGSDVPQVMSMLDSRDGLVRRQTYNQVIDWGFSETWGWLLKSEELKNEQIISRKTYLPATRTNDAYYNWRGQYTSSTTEERYETGGAKNGQLISIKTTDFSLPDTYGNFATVTTTITDRDVDSPYNGQVWQTIQTYVFQPDAGVNWCVNLPTNTTIRKEAPGVPAIVRTIAFGVDYVKCRLTQSINEPARTTDYRLVKSYEYDGFGNINKTTTTGATSGTNTPATRIESSDWGTTGQFPISTTNALGQQTTYGYDYDHGVRTRVTDPNNRSIYTSYDAFQREVSELNADGTGTTWSLTDCRATSSCFNANQRLQVYQRVLGVGAALQSDAFTFLDQFDRPLVTRGKLMDGTYSQTETRYSARGLVEQQSMPCIVGNCTAYWATSYYDDQARVTKVTRPISSTNSALQETNIAYLGRKTVVTDAQGKSSTQINTVVGKLGRTIDHNGYYQSFTYDAFGSLLNVTDSQGASLFTSTYDYGAEPFQRTVQDVDLGTRTYNYNAFGEQISSSDGKGQSFSMEYDALSRLKKRTEPDAVTDWTWGNSASARNIGVLESAQTTAEGVTYREDQTYDSIGRLAKTTYTVPVSGTSAYDYSYNSTNGLLDTLTYPASTAGYRLKLQYGYQNGVTSQVSDYNSGTVYWRANAMNARGQLTNESLGNGIVTNTVFDSVTGWIKTVQSGPNGNPTAVQNASYLQDLVGNITQRQNNNLGLTESFYYDNVYRLDYSQLNGSTNLRMCYDNPTANVCTKNLPGPGNISSRSDIGTGTYGTQWTYDAIKKHAVLNAGGNTYSYDANGNASARNGNAISWTSYNYPKQINNVGGETIIFSYGPNRQRWKSVYTSATGQPTETTYKIGSGLEQVVIGTSTEYRYYISGGTGPVAIYTRKSDGTNVLRYTLEDHAGSIDKIVSDTGAVQYGESFAAFGARRNATTWSGAVPSAELDATNAVTRQGYTGQEMLGRMGLIHMNGRVQDSITGRFLSADPTIPDPANTQHYNRYSYVVNNPVTFTDPTGFTPGHNDGHDDDPPDEVISTVVDEVVITAKRAPPNSAPPPAPGSAWLNVLGRSQGSILATTMANEGKAAPIRLPEDSQETTMDARGARDRGRTARPDGTPRPNKHIKPWKERPGWVVDTSNPDGKKVHRPARPGEPGYGNQVKSEVNIDPLDVALGLGVVVGIVVLPEIVGPIVIFEAATK